MRNDIRLSGVLPDTFGKSGLPTINGLIEETPIEQILETLHNPRTLKKQDEIEQAIWENSVRTTSFIRQSLESIRHHDAQITQCEERILKNLCFAQEPLKILMSVPGIGFTIGLPILPEIGDISQFGRPHTGSLRNFRENCTRAYHQTWTKFLRTMFIEAAQTIACAKPTG